MKTANILKEKKKSMKMKKQNMKMAMKCREKWKWKLMKSRENEILMKNENGRKQSMKKNAIKRKSNEAANRKISEMKHTA